VNVPVPPVPLVLRSTSAEDTRAMAAVMSGSCMPGDVLLLAGDLGAGKTTFAQGFAAGLGVTETVTSPTFTLVRPYPTHAAGPVRTLLHADVWRLERLHEIVDLGMGELVEDGAVALVEWGDAAEPVLGAEALAVDLAAGATDDERVITVLPSGSAWTGRWPGLAHALAGWARPS
jgi:tRNA threonylcarbamoyladenosine biosynthesis protein TsaE